MVIGFDQSLPPVYLERFNPPENVPTVVSVLALQSIAIEYHWVDIPVAGIKGKYRCTGGICCQAFGQRIQNYNIPIWVYTNPKSGSTDGHMYVWSISNTVYKQLIELASRYDLLTYDIEVTRVKQGQGTRTAITLVPAPQLRASMTPEQLAQINSSIQTYFQVGESSLVTEANEQEYQQMLMQGGYDFQNNCFPQLAPPQPGFGVPNQRALGGMMTQPGRVVGANPVAAPGLVAPAPAGWAQAPQPAIPNIPNVPPAPNPVPPQVTPAPQLNAAANIPPVGTSSTPVPPQVPQNAIAPTGGTVISAAELDSLLDD